MLLTPVEDGNTDAVPAVMGFVVKPPPGPRGDLRVKQPGTVAKIVGP